MALESDGVRTSGRAVAAFFTVYRAIWLALFAVAVAAVGFANARAELLIQRQNNAGFALGIQLYGNLAANGLLLGAFGEEGERLGFREGDLLIAVDGRRVRKFESASIAALSGRAGTVADLIVRHPDGNVVRLRVARDPERLTRAYAGWGIDFASRRWIAFAVRELAGIASLLAALLLFLRRPRDPVAQLLSVSLVLGQATFANVLPTTPGFLPDLQTAITNVLLTLAVLLFPQGRLRTRLQWLALAAAVASNAVIFTLYLQSSVPDWSQFLYAIGPGTLLVAAIERLRRTPPGIARQQVKSVLFGIALFCVLLLFNDLLVQVQYYATSAGVEAWIILLAHLAEAFGFVAIPAGLLVSLLRFRLYDAESAISRSVAFGALTVILLAVFAASGKLIEVVGERYIGAGLGAWSGALGAAIAAAITVPLHGRVTRWAERRFQGDLFRLRRGLPALVGDLRETADPAALAEATLARVATGVRSAHGAVVAGGRLVAVRAVAPEQVGGWLDGARDLRTDHDRLHTNRGDPLFPMRVPLHADGIGLAGWLLLGPRHDGSFYGKDECDALLEIADPVARALAIAVTRENREAAQQRDYGQLRQMVDALCQALKDRLDIDVRAMARPSGAAPAG